MTTVAEMLRRTDRIEIKNEILQSLYDTREDFVKQQRDQMIHGLRNDGSLIGRYKNPIYATMKFSASSKAGYGNVDLYLTGAFQGAIGVEVRDDALIPFSADRKAPILEDKYGNEIWGLNDTYRPPFIDANRVVFFGRVKRALHLNYESVFGLR